MVLVVFALVAATACGDADADLTAGASAGPGPSPRDPAASSGPIGGGRASGTGADVELACPDGVELDTEEWYGPAGLTQREAVAEAFGDLIVGWVGEPFEIASTDTWSSWGLHDDADNLVAVATVVVNA